VKHDSLKRGSQFTGAIVFKNLSLSNTQSLSLSRILSGCHSLILSISLSLTLSVFLSFILSVSLSLSLSFTLFGLAVTIHITIDHNSLFHF